MDVVEIIRTAIERLPEGDHSIGLQSVVRHIEAAVAHLSRGQDTLDDGAFTDAIYRTNQAFEGSVKEAYRVLAGKDPSKLKPATIENYLERGKHLRERVLTQLRRYRQEWRNPSTHDYNLDFDEDEAFLAIVSVSAFAKVLVDQISEKLAFEEAAAAPPPPPPKALGRIGIDKAVSMAATLIGASEIDVGTSAPTESQIVGALAGYLSQMPSVEIQPGFALKIGSRLISPDLLVTSDGEPWIIEIKIAHRGLSVGPTSPEIAQLVPYMMAAHAKNAVLLFYRPGTQAYVIQEVVELGQNRISIVRPNAE